ncbi:10242_t:CDS:2, partial [Funneliformis mosseae]
MIITKPEQKLANYTCEATTWLIESSSNSSYIEFYKCCLAVFNLNHHGHDLRNVMDGGGVCAYIRLQLKCSINRNYNKVNENNIEEVNSQEISKSPEI